MTKGQLPDRIKIENIRKVFNAGTVNEKVALKGLNLQLQPGDFAVLVALQDGGQEYL